jgi:hypothetical protein
MFMQEIAFSSFNVEEVMPPGGSRTKTLGKDAPGVALAGVDGRKTDIKDLRGKTLLFTFGPRGVCPAGIRPPL